MLGEIGILVLVVAATAWLIQSPPARTEVRPKLLDRTVQLDFGGSVQVVIDPARAGRNEIHLYFTGEDGRIDDEVTGVELTAAGGGRGIEGLDLGLLASGPGHFTTSGKTIPFAGTWSFLLDVERGRFETEAARFSAEIGASE